MHTTHIMQAVRNAAVVIAFAVAIFAGYSVVGYVTHTLTGAAAIGGGACSGCGGWIDIPVRHMGSYNYLDGGGGGGGGGGSFTPYCTLTITRGPMVGLSHPPQYQYTITWSAPVASSFSISGIGPVTPAPGGTYTFTSAATSGTYTGTAVTPYGTVTCNGSIPPPPPPTSCKLEITKTVSKTTAAPGEHVTYTITVKNTGNAPCTGAGVKVTDALDERWEYVSQDTSANILPGYFSAVYHSASHTLTWNADVLDPGESGWMKVVVRAPNLACGVYKVIPNSASVTSYEYNNFQDLVTAAAPTVRVGVDCPPPPQNACGIDIALALDVSLSIDQTELQQMKSAVVPFVQGFGSQAQFSVTSFFRTATVNRAFTADKAAVVSTINALTIGSLTGTNWDDALAKAHSTFDPRPDVPNVIVLASDGYPNTWGTGPVPENPGTWSVMGLNAAITRANAIKASGTRIVALGIGSDIREANLQAIASPDSYYTASSFATLGATLQNVSNELCGGTLTVKKIIDQDGNPHTTNDQSPGQGWTFGFASQSKVTGTNGMTDAVSVNAGTYSITETAKTGYQLVAASCTGSGGTLSGNTLSGVVVGTGAGVVCTFYNKPLPPPGECALEIEKSVSKSHAAPNDEVEYTIEFKNTGGKKCTGSGVKVVDVIDQRLTYLSETRSSNVTAGYLSEPLYAPSTRTLTWNAWDLDPGETGWVKWKAKVGTPSACTETIPNTAKITALEYANFTNWVTSNTVNLTVAKDCHVPILACTLSVSKSNINPGESVIVSWTSSHAVSGFINGSVGTTSPVGAGQMEIYPSDDITYIGTFKNAGGQSVTCQAAVTIKKGGGGCTGNCGGGLNQPNVVLLDKPGDAPLAFVSLSQIPYTGFEAGPALTIIFWTTVGLIAALVTYLVMGKGGIQYVLAGALGFAGVTSKEYAEADMPRVLPQTYTHTESSANGYHAAASTAIAPHVLVTPPPAAPAPRTADITEVIEARANAAGVLISPEAVQLAVNLSADRGEALRMFGDILNAALKAIPREDGWVLLTSERFADLASTTPKAAPRASVAATPTVEEILSSVMTPPPAAPVQHRNVEMPMADAADQAIVLSLARAILAGDRDRAYAVVRTLEANGANAASVMTVVAGALDQLYRARRRGQQTDLAADAGSVSDAALESMVETFTHGMDAAYANPFTSLKLAVAQAFEARA